jgi:hypothetical protein
VEGGLITLNELELRAGSFVIPLTGELVQLDQPRQVALALETVRELKRRLDDARAALEDVLRLESERAGSRTLHLGNLDAVVSGGEKVDYDHVELATQLRAAGLPEPRLAELIVETVSYRVDQRVARSVAAANPDYAAALDRCRRVLPAPWRVTIKKGRQ